MRRVFQQLRTPLNGARPINRLPAEVLALSTRRWPDKDYRPLRRHTPEFHLPSLEGDRS